MPVVQPVLETVTNTHTHTYIIYMIIVGKSMPIDNYEQYKRVINQITGRLYMHIYIRNQEQKVFCFVFWCVFLQQSASEPFIKLCFEAGK